MRLGEVAARFFSSLAPPAPPRSYMQAYLDRLSGLRGVRLELCPASGIHADRVIVAHLHGWPRRIVIPSAVFDLSPEDCLRFVQRAVDDVL